MELQKFMTTLDRIVVQNGRGCAKNRVAIAVYRPGSLGGSPVVDVKDVEIVHIKDASKGIDWDSSKIILTLEQEVSTLTPDQRDAILENARRENSIEAYQQFKALREKIKHLEKIVELTLPAYREKISTNDQNPDQLAALEELLAGLNEHAVREK